MKSRRYVAEWLDDINEPPEGEEFEPTRDAVYERRAFWTWDDAADWVARHDMNGEGRVDCDYRDRQEGKWETAERYVVYAPDDFERIHQSQSGRSRRGER